MDDEEQKRFFMDIVERDYIGGTNNDYWWLAPGRKVHGSKRV
jgi:hypothetical protein